MLWNISRMLNGLYEKFRIMHVMDDFLMTIGSSTLIYVCTNQWMIRCILPTFDSLNQEWTALVFLTRILTLITVCFACHIVGNIFENSEKLKKFIGK